MEQEKRAILILEDEGVLSKALRIALEHEGFDVEMTPTGEEALEKLGGKKFDFFLIDLVLPGVDGFEVLKRIREFDKESTVFVLSNLSDDSNKDRAMKLGATEYFVKSETLLSEISIHIKKKIK